jgi:hypothetical protein
MNTLQHNTSFDIVTNYTSLFEFDFWDILFVGQNQANEWIIGSLARDDKEKNVLHHYYLLVPEYNLKEYLELKISYRDLYPLAKSIFRTIRDINENIITEEKILYENLKDENMPRKNSFCPDYEERQELLKLLQKPKPILGRVLGKRKEKVLVKYH